MQRSVCYNCPRRDYPRYHNDCREREEEVARNDAVREARRKDKEAHCASMEVIRHGKEKAGQR